MVEVTLSAVLTVLAENQGMGWAIAQVAMRSVSMNSKRFMRSPCR